MKYRVITLLLALLLLLAACEAPWDQEEPQLQPVDFYYAAAEETSYELTTGALYQEIRDLGTQQYTWQDILQLYLSGPEDIAAISPFPETLTVQEQTLQSGLLTITVSEEWTAMTGVEKSLAEACLVLTMTQFPEVESVCIRTQSDSESEPLTRNDFLLYDDSATSDQVTVKLYFSDANGRYMVEETRSRTFETENEIPAFILNELIEGPENESSLPVLPEGTNLLQVQIDQGVCTADFSEAFWSNRPSTHVEARMAIFSVVNALTELSQVESVRFLCVGEPVEDYVGLDLSQPMYREELALGQSRNVMTSLDGTLYVPCGSSGKLAAVPTLIRQTAGRVGAEAVLSALLSFKPANGYENPFPDGSMAMELTTANGVCTVTFNSAFGLCDTDPEQAQNAVRSVVTTLCALNGIERVQIIVNGGTLTNVDISKPLTPEESWMLP